MLKLVLAILFVFATQDTAQISGVVQDENDQPVVAVDGKVRFRGVVNPILLRRLLRAEGR